MNRRKMSPAEEGILAAKADARSSRMTREELAALLKEQGFGSEIERLPLEDLRVIYQDWSVTGVVVRRRQE